MPDFLDRLLGRGGAPRQPAKSAQAAKERLQLVLVHDRADIPPAALEQLKDEIITLISKYVEINRAGVEINLTHTEQESRLVADIPILNPTRKTRRRSGNK